MTMQTMTLTRRRFVGSTVAAGTAFSVLKYSSNAFAASDDFISKSATEIAAMIRNKEITAVEAVKHYYARIDEVNPKINAVVAFCRERAMAEAQEADALLAAGRSMGPLHGVPFTAKDSFDTAGLV